MHTVNYAEIVRRMKLDFPITHTVPDVFTGGPITISRDNILNLLVVDADNPVLEGQVVSALYGEMARFKRATELAAAKAEASFRKWKAARGHELTAKMPEKKTAAGKKSAKQGPTTTEMEAYYRDHKDYDLMHDEPARLNACAGLFEDLMWAFKMKSEMLSDLNKLVGGFYATEARGDRVAHGNGGDLRLTDYASLAAEASNLADDDSVEVAKRLAEQVSATSESDDQATPKQARSLD